MSKLKFVWEFYGPDSKQLSIHHLNHLKEFLQEADKKKLKVTILGAGSNILVRDGGIRGVTISLIKSFSNISYLNNQKVYVGAGVNCIKLSRESASKSLERLPPETQKQWFQI